ncbi:mitochondrial ATPase expression-domain-containing protein [Aspergillus venezuelensis]
MRPTATAPWLARGLTGSSSMTAWKWNTTTASKPPKQDTEVERTDKKSVDQKGAARDKSPKQNAVPAQDVKNTGELRNIFYSILETAQPDQVMDALLHGEFKELVATMPQAVFIEALHLLSPAYFTEPYKRILRPMHPSAVEYKQFKPEQTIFDDFVKKLSAIIAIRHEAGHTLGLAEYTHLLDCARSIGDATMADYVWHSMRRHGVAPDVQCYNHLMAAKVWDGACTGLEKYRVRALPFNYRKRRFGDKGWEGYGTAGRSVRPRVRELFNEMTEAGHEGDEASIVNLLMASARVGDHGGIGRILKSIWNVDVDLLVKGEPCNVTEYARTSPFYPSGHLLTAVAHAYCTNNDLQAAIVTIGHISTCYDLDVPESVWDELFEWAFVLSRRRGGADAEMKSTGHDFATKPFFIGLFEEMTQEPINVKPTVEMHMRLGVDACRSCYLRQFLTHIRAAYEIMDETRRKSIAARRIVESYLRYPRADGGNIDPQILRSKGFADAVHTYDILRTLVMQQCKFLERLAKLLVFKFARPWNLGKGMELTWQCRLRPQLLEEWRDFLPQQFRAPTESGEVTISGMTTFNHPRLYIHSGLQLRRPSLGDNFTLDQADLDEVNDDALWTYYESSLSNRDRKLPIIQRLYEPVLVDFADYEAAANLEEQVLDHEFTETEQLSRAAVFPRQLHAPFWRENAEASVDRKIGALARCFGSFPGSPDERRPAFDAMDFHTVDLEPVDSY